MLHADPFRDERVDSSAVARPESSLACIKGLRSVLGANRPLSWHPAQELGISLASRSIPGTHLLDNAEVLQGERQKADHAIDFIATSVGHQARGYRIAFP
jgi:hypothetical protein